MNRVRVNSTHFPVINADPNPKLGKFRKKINKTPKPWTNGNVISCFFFLISLREPLSTLARAGIFRGLEARSNKGGHVREVAAWRSGEGRTHRTPARISNFLKNQWKIYNFDNFNGNLCRFFKEILKFYEFSRKFGQRFMKIFGLYISWEFWWRIPEASEFRKNSRKIYEYLQFF